MTNKLSDVDSMQSNILVEAAWKRDVQLQGRRAMRIWSRLLASHFPTLQVFPEQSRVVPTLPPQYFLPREPTRTSRTETPLLSLDSILDRLKNKYSSRLEIKKLISTNANGNPAIEMLRVRRCCHNFLFIFCCSVKYKKKLYFIFPFLRQFREMLKVPLRVKVRIVTKRRIVPLLYLLVAQTY